MAYSASVSCGARRRRLSPHYRSAVGAILPCWRRRAPARTAAASRAAGKARSPGCRGFPAGRASASRGIPRPSSRGAAGRPSYRPTSRNARTRAPRSSCARHRPAHRRPPPPSFVTTSANVRDVPGLRPWRPPANCVHNVLDSRP